MTDVFDIQDGIVSGSSFDVMSCWKSSPSWDRGCRVIMTGMSLFERVEARHAGSRDVLGVARDEGQTMHVGSGGQQAVDRRECRSAFIRPHSSATF